MSEGLEQVHIKLINKPSVDIVDLLYGIAKKSITLRPLFGVDDPIQSRDRERKIQELIDIIFISGHMGILEHVSFTFEIHGVSRKMTHQAVRNRIASFLESSLRYVGVDKEDAPFQYVVPEAIRGQEHLKEEFQKDIDKIMEIRQRWVLMGEHLGLDKQSCNELGRNLIPHCASTGYVFSMNLASIVMLLKKRCCTRAEKEFRNAMIELASIMKREVPWMRDRLGAFCEVEGYCPEGARSCGRKPTMAAIMTGYKNSLQE